MEHKYYADEIQPNMLHRKDGILSERFLWRMEYWNNDKTKKIMG